MSIEEEHGELIKLFDPWLSIGMEETYNRRSKIIKLGYKDRKELEILHLHNIIDYMSKEFLQSFRIEDYIDDVVEDWLGDAPGGKIIYGLNLVANGLHSSSYLNNLFYQFRNTHGPDKCCGIHTYIPISRPSVEYIVCITSDDIEVINSILGNYLSKVIPGEKKYLITMEELIDLKLADQ